MSEHKHCTSVKIIRDAAGKLRVIKCILGRRHEELNCSDGHTQWKAGT